MISRNNRAYDIKVGTPPRNDRSVGHAVSRGGSLVGHMIASRKVEAFVESVAPNSSKQAGWTLGRNLELGEQRREFAWKKRFQIKHYIFDTIHSSLLDKKLIVIWWGQRVSYYQSSWHGGAKIDGAVRSVSVSFLPLFVTPLILQSTFRNICYLDYSSFKKSNFLEKMKSQFLPSEEGSTCTKVMSRRWESEFEL